MNKILVVLAALLLPLLALAGVNPVLQNPFTTNANPVVSVGVVTNGGLNYTLGSGSLTTGGNLLTLQPNINTVYSFESIVLGTSAVGFVIDPQGVAWGNGLGLSNVIAAGVSGALNATNLPPPSLVNGTLAQQTYGPDIPVPFAWYDASQLNTNDGASIVFWPDATGNTNNLMSPYNPFSSTTFNTYSSHGMNGMPCVFMPGGIVGNYVDWTNGTMVVNGFTNFTVFQVYSDTYHGTGLSFWSGPAGGNSTLDFEPYATNANSYNSMSFAQWDWTSGGLFRVTDVNSGQAEIAAMRCNGLTSLNQSYDPSIWQNGVLNARLGTYRSAAFTAGGQPYLSNSIAIGGPFRNNTGLFWEGGNIAETIIYTNALTDIQMNAVHAYLRAKYGFAVHSLTIATASEIGNFAAAQSNWVQIVQQLMPTWSVHSMALAGLTASNIYQQVSNIVQYPKWPGGSYMLIQEGGNDFTNAGGNPIIFNVTNAIVQAVELCNSNGYVPILGTMWSNTNCESGLQNGMRTNYNNWVYANAQTYGYFILDFAANPLIGPLGAYANPTYFAWNNWQHPTTNTYPNIIGPMTRDGVLKIATPQTLYSVGAFTNITTGQKYTNVTMQTMSWRVPVVVSQPATTLGYAEVDAWLQPLNAPATVGYQVVDSVTISGGGTSVLATNKGTLVFDVPPGWGYTVSNSLSGSGYAATLDAGKTNMVTFHP